MSNVPAIIAAEADLARRLRASSVLPLEARTSAVEAEVLRQGMALTGFEALLNSHNSLAVQYGGALANVETTLGSHNQRLTAAEAELVSLAGRVSALENGPMKVVTTAAQLTAALLLGGTIFVYGMITVAAAATASIDGTEIIALGRGSGITHPHDGAVGKTCIYVEAARVKLQGLDLSTGDPMVRVAVTSGNLVPGRQYIVYGSAPTGNYINPHDAGGSPTGVPHYRGATFTALHATFTTVGSVTVRPYLPDCGVEISSSTSVNVDELTIDDCDFHDIYDCVRRWPGSTTAEPGRGWRIQHNRMHGFMHAGLYLNWHFEGMFLWHNSFKGRDEGQTHIVEFNAIWLGNYADRSTIGHNDITEVDRHAIEFWNSNSGPANTDGNRHCHIFGNTIWSIGGQADSIISPVGSFGITAFGNGAIKIYDNTINGYIGIGIELYNDGVNLGHSEVRGNTMLGGRSAAIPTGITLHGVLDTCLDDNTIEDLQSTTTNVEAFGLHIKDYAGIGCRGLTVTNNKFNNAGNRMIYVDGNGTDTYEGLTIRGNVFKYASRPWTVPSGQYSAVYLQRPRAAVVMRSNESWYATAIGAAVGNYMLEDASLIGGVSAGNVADAPITSAFGSCQGTTNLHLAI